MTGLTNSATSDRRTKRASDLSTGHAESAPVPTGTVAGPMTSGMASGLVAGTRVATAIGWRNVEAIQPGDKVLTFDAGLQEVTHVTHGRLWAGEKCPAHLWPLYVPEGALGNLQPLMVLPEQPVMVESDVGDELYGDPFTLVPASALDGFRGITRVEPVPGLEVVTLHFCRDQVIFSAAGAIFFCPSLAAVSLHDLLHGLIGDYTVLDGEEADFLIGCIEVDESRTAPWRSADTQRAA